MSSVRAPYPQDRARARTERGDALFEDARHALGQKEAKLQAEAERYGEERRDESEEERAERLSEEASERLRDVQDEIFAGED